MRKKTQSKHPCKGTKIDGKPCSNNAAYASEGLCKIHFLKKLHDRMTDKEDTMRTMAAPVTKSGDVWIGSLASAQHKAFLERYGIKSILNVSGIEPLPHTKKMLKDHRIKYCTFTEIDPVTKEEKYMPDAKFDDEFTKQDFLNYAKKAITFLKNCPKPVLTNCQAGMNRSAAMIAAYLVCARGKSFEKTVHLLEKANKTRGIPALKNMHFRRMIQELDNIKKYRHRKHSSRSSHSSHPHRSHKHKTHTRRHKSHSDTHRKQHKQHKRHSHSNNDRHHPYSSFLPYIE